MATTARLGSAFTHAVNPAVLLARGLAGWRAARAALLNPEHWVFLSACDWHADGDGFPVHPTDLLRPSDDRA